MQLVIRHYRSSDKDAVCTLFSTGTLEHTRSCFYNAMTCPLYINITLALCVAGLLFGSVLGAVVLPGVWVSLIYYCSHEAYASYVRERLRTDMQDIPGNFLSRPDDCFWVAGGGIRIVGLQFVNSHKEEEKATTFATYFSNIMDKSVAVEEYVLKCKH